MCKEITVEEMQQTIEKPDYLTMGCDKHVFMLSILILKGN